jgi:hypothetical protein
MRKWLILMVLAAVAALVAAGCGSSGGSGGSSAAPSASSGAGAKLSAAAIMKKSEAAMQKMNSAAVDANVSMKVNGDTSKITDAQTKALLGSPIAVSAKGDISNDPQKADMTVDLQFMGQTLTLGLRMDGTQTWVEFENTWYTVDQSTLQGITGASASPAPSASTNLTDTFKQLGIDPQGWVGTWTLAGEETLDGADVYHLTGTIDMAKLAKDISGLTSSASGLGAITGGSTSGTSAQDLQKAVDSLKTAVKNVSIDEYIQKDTFYLAKLDAKATLDMTALPAADRKGAEGIDSMDFSAAMGMSNFDQAVSVTAPPNPKTMNDLLTAIMGSDVFKSISGGSSL